MPIVRIVSGGQTGADRGGLEAALHCNVPHSGWCPKGRLAEDGMVPRKYRLRETGSDDYSTRTEANVLDSDATAVFTMGQPSGGSLETIGFAVQHGKPWIHFDIGALSSTEIARALTAWLACGSCARDGYSAMLPRNYVLNVAGSRESQCAGMESFVFEVMMEVLANPDIRTPKRNRFHRGPA